MDRRYKRLLVIASDSIICAVSAAIAFMLRLGGWNRNSSGNRNAARAFGNTGHGLTYAQRQPGFVCRVSGLPDPSRETCGNTPPTDAYWGLFWSDGQSGTWSYSSVGIGSLKVPAGGFIGWRFQGLH